MNKLAQVDIGPTFGSPFGQTKSLADLVSLIIRFSFTGAGLIILFIFIFAGFNILMGAGNSDPQQAAKGKQAASAAALGFLVVFMAYWIIRIIELILGTSLITAPNLGV